MTSDLNKKIEQAKQQLEQMIDLNPEIMLLVDHNHTILRANRALLTFIDMPDFQPVLNNSLEDIFHCKDKNFFNILLKNESGCLDMETQVDLPGKKSCYLKFTIIGSGKENDIFALIIHDVTDEKSQAAHIEKKHKKQAVQELTGALLHNVNQPLTVILMRAQLMQLQMEAGKVEPEAFSDSLHDIVRFTMHIADMIKAVEKPKKYVTQQYSENIDILDLKKSTAPKNTKDMIKALLIALDTHMPGDWIHAKRTAAYAEILSIEMGIKKRELETIKRGALLHDIGKIGVSNTILKKPSPLDADETTIMRKHAETGHNMLAQLSTLDSEAMTAGCHHERFDGSGYPEGLAGNDIPLSARIVAIADTFDALRAERPYHKPTALKAVVKEIKEGSGTHFDPAVVKAFENCYEEMDKLFN